MRPAIRETENLSEKLMHAKCHEQKNYLGQTRRMVAACDSELLGKVLRGPGEVVLDLRLYKSFYEGKRVSEGELRKMLAGAENVNLVGEKVIGVASEVLQLDAKKAKKIGGVPHLQFYKI